MDTNSFDALVGELAYWWSNGNPPDWVRLTDSDRLRDLPNVAEKRKWLRKAKIESIRRTIQERIDEIIEAWDNSNYVMIDLLLEAFPEDLKCYGANLTNNEQKNWINRASLAACGRQSEITAKDSVIYFVSADDELLKIGHTTNFRSRLRSLQTSQGMKLKILW